VVAEILQYHQARSGNALMGRAAERAQQLGYRVVPPGGSGDARYLRLVLDGTPVTLHLDGARLTADAKPLRAFARSLPHAVPTTRDVQFPLGGVEIDVLEAFAGWGHSAAPGHSAPPPPRPIAPRQRPPVPVGRPRAPWENPGTSENPAPGIALPPPPAPARGATAPAAPRSTALLAAGITLLLVVLGAVSGGAGAALIMGGLAVVAVGTIALVRGAAPWAHIASRGIGGAVVAGGLAVLLAGGALTSTPTDPAADNAPASAPSPTTSTAAAPSSPSEAEIAAAEAALAELEAQEGAPTGVDPVTGLLSDQAAQGAIDGAARTSALAALAAVPVKGRAPTTGYDRDLFGNGWVDTDHNGCDTRNDILARDLTGETFKPGTRNCVVLTGTLAEPYSGRRVTFQRGPTTSDDVQIDHVVALSDAWQKGAQGWDGAKRTRFANDPHLPRRPASTTRTAPRPAPPVPRRSTAATPATHPTSTATATASAASRGASGVALDQAGLVGQHHGLDAVAQVQLGEDPRDVGLHRRLGHVELFADLGVRQSAGHGAQHLQLARGQLRQRRHELRRLADRWPAHERLDQPARDARREQRLARGAGPDGVGEGVRRRGLQQEPGRPGLQRLEHVVVQVEHRQHQHARPGAAGDDLGGRGQPVAAGHLDVHQDDVRREVPRRPHRGRPVGRLADHLHPGSRAEDGRQPAAQQVVVVDHEHPHRLAHACTRTGSRGIRACTRKPPPAARPVASSPPT
jgi:Protein of unknown function (DUF1524)